MDMGIGIVLGIVVLFCIVVLSWIVKFSISAKTILKDDVKKIIANKNVKDFNLSHSDFNR